MPAASSSPQRTQQQRSETTVRELLAAARALFASQGFAATSLDEIAARANVTKGALYHHFTGKREIFRAVCEREQKRLTGLQSSAFREQPDAWSGFKAGCEAYLEAAVDPGIQQIMLLDAPVVLGWEAIRELEQETYAMAAAGMRRAMDEERIARRPPEPLLDLLFGALGAASMSIARAEEPARALRATTAELRRLLDGLAGA